MYIYMISHAPIVIFFETIGRAIEQMMMLLVIQILEILDLIERNRIRSRSVFFFFFPSSNVK